MILYCFCERVAKAVTWPIYTALIVWHWAIIIVFHSLALLFHLSVYNSSGQIFLYVGRNHTLHWCLLFVSLGQLTRWQTSLWPRRPIKAQFLCSVLPAVVSMATLGLMACALCAIRSTCQGRTMAESVLWVPWVRPAVSVKVSLCFPVHTGQNSQPLCLTVTCGETFLPQAVAPPLRCLPSRG